MIQTHVKVNSINLSRMVTFHFTVLPADDYAVCAANALHARAHDVTNCDKRECLSTLEGTKLHQPEPTSSNVASESARPTTCGPSRLAQIGTVMSMEIISSSNQVRATHCQCLCVSWCLFVRK